MELLILEPTKRDTLVEIKHINTQENEIVGGSEAQTKKRRFDAFENKKVVDDMNGTSARKLMRMVKDLQEQSIARIWVILKFPQCQRIQIPISKVTSSNKSKLQLKSKAKSKAIIHSILCSPTMMTGYEQTTTEIKTATETMVLEKPPYDVGDYVTEMNHVRDNGNFEMKCENDYYFSVCEQSCQNYSQKMNFMYVKSAKQRSNKEAVKGLTFGYKNHIGLGRESKNHETMVLYGSQPGSTSIAPLLYDQSVCLCYRISQCQTILVLLVQENRTIGQHDFYLDVYDIANIVDKACTVGKEYIHQPTRRLNIGVRSTQLTDLYLNFHLIHTYILVTQCYTLHIFNYDDEKYYLHLRQIVIESIFHGTSLNDTRLIIGRKQSNMQHVFRFLDFISSFDDDKNGVSDLTSSSSSVIVCKTFNDVDDDDDNTNKDYWDQKLTNLIQSRSLIVEKEVEKYEEDVEAKEPLLANVVESTKNPNSLIDTEFVWLCSNICLSINESIIKTLVTGTITSTSVRQYRKIKYHKFLLVDKSTLEDNIVINRPTCYLRKCVNEIHYIFEDKSFLFYDVHHTPLHWIIELVSKLVNTLAQLLLDDILFIIASYLT